MGANFTLPNDIQNGTTGDADEVMGNFNTILSNFTPTGMDDASANVAAMQTTVDPYPGDSESLATDEAGELHRLRFVLKEAFGSAEWYISKELLGLSGGTMTGAIVLPAGTVGAPAIGWTDTGFYEGSPDNITVSLGGVGVASYTATSYFMQTATAAAMMNEAATSTNPTLVPNRADLDTGIGWATDTLHVIINGTSSVSFDGTGIVTPVFSGGLTATASTGKALATDYLAATDLFVTAWITDTQTTLNGLSDSATTPTTTVATNQAIRPFISFFVKKGDYFRVTAGAGTVVIRDVAVGA
jgi:hypothetical protein